MKSIFLVLCLVAPTLAFSAAWRNYSEPTKPIYQGTFSSKTNVSNPNFRVVTMNILFSSHLDQILTLFKENEVFAKADAILLQEVVGEPNLNESSARELAGKLGLNYLYVPAFIHQENEKDFGVAILSRHPMTDPEKIILPHPHEIYRTQRVAAGSTIHTPNGDFRIYSVHAETLQFTNWRLDQIEAVIERAQHWSNMPTIIGGDFNSSPPWQRLSLLNYFQKHGYTVATKDVPGTTFRTMRGIIRFRLDHIFVKGAKANAAGKIPSNGASDHDFIWADIIR